MVCVRGRRGVREGSEEWRGAGWPVRHHPPTPGLSNSRVDGKVGAGLPAHGRCKDFGGGRRKEGAVSCALCLPQRNAEADDLCTRLLMLVHMYLCAFVRQW